MQKPKTIFAYKRRRVKKVLEKKAWKKASSMLLNDGLNTIGDELGISGIHMAGEEPSSYNRNISSSESIAIILNLLDYTTLLQSSKSIN